jgi:plastocyanin
LLFLLLLPLIAACSRPSSASATASGSGASTAPQQLTVKSEDTMKFEPASLTAKPGQPIQLTLDNSDGKIVHEFDITEGVAAPVKITAQPGQKASSTFTIEKAGTYPYFCGEPGHEQAGMKGTLTVQS